MRRVGKACSKRQRHPGRGRQTAQVRNVQPAARGRWGRHGRSGSFSGDRTRPRRRASPGTPGRGCKHVTGSLSRRAWAAPRTAAFLGREAGEAEGSGSGSRPGQACENCREVSETAAGLRGISSARVGKGRGCASIGHSAEEKDEGVSLKRRKLGSRRCGPSPGHGHGLPSEHAGRRVRHLIHFA